MYRKCSNFNTSYCTKKWAKVSFFEVLKFTEKAKGNRTHSKACFHTDQIYLRSFCKGSFEV